ncbi:MAG: methionine gamma-lyase family protein [Clostridia bacterium]|nr:methionine gamma-lyase family protein [Clostridia bacterium]
MEKNKAIEVVEKCEKELEKAFKQIDRIVLSNQEKVLNAFKETNVQLTNFACSSGYGYDDMGKPKLCQLFAKIFGTEDALVCPQITCGTHALTLPLFGILRPGDTLLSITGMPYDTIIDSLTREGNGSLKDFGIDFKVVEMHENEIDMKEVEKQIKAVSPKIVYIQRSRGYSARDALSAYYIGDIIKQVKAIKNDAIVMVDNCYGEFTEEKEPTDFGADIMAGSLIKNPGGGVAPTGGYVVGRADLVRLCAGRLTSPTLGAEVGSYMASYYPYFQGIFIAPHVVGGALKGSLLLGKVFETLGIESTPKVNEVNCDIIRSIKFNDEKKLIDFCQLVQSMSPVDSNVVPMPWDMPGYNDKVIMAAGTFVQGASIELSCDGPIRPPYMCYLQGGITYEHVKLLAIATLEKMG